MTKILLHACCGPCSLEPVRLLRQEGHELTIFYANANIHPRDEYQRRLDTLLAWAETEGIPVIEGTYDPDAWSTAVGPADTWGDDHAQRCRACYRLRLEESARYAAEHGFEALSTTLAVSPYQFTDIIAEEVQRAADAYGLQAVFQDFRPYYPEATRASRALGMYRQNYCGCAFSNAEAAAEREEAKRRRTLEKAEARAKNAEQRAAEEAQRKLKREQHAAWEEKQRAKKRARNAVRAQERDGD